jgi:hypothetical protein
MAKYIVTLTEKERVLLQKMVSSGKGAARKLLHARILLHADANGLARTDEVTSQALHVGLSTIHRVRQRFVEQSFESALAPARPPVRPEKVKIMFLRDQDSVAGLLRSSFVTRPSRPCWRCRLPTIDLGENKRGDGLIRGHTDSMSRIWANVESFQEQHAELS